MPFFHFYFTLPKNLGRAVGYKYPHDYPNSYVKQQYLPDNLVGRKYYEPGENKFENGIKSHLNNLNNY